MPAHAPSTDDFRAERDALALLGLFSRLYLAFDPPVPSPQHTAAVPPPTHFAGLNIHALMVDNRDGEVVAAERNLIHQTESPVEHAEQRAVRTAHQHLRRKRPRSTTETVEDYYRNGLFYEAGVAPQDFVSRGVTVYTSLEPCPMCATTLLVCRVKRVVYVLPDRTYGGAWQLIKDRFYSKYELSYGPPVLEGSEAPIPTRVAPLYHEILRQADALRQAKVIDTHLFDGLRPLLESAFGMLTGLRERDLLVTTPTSPNRETLVGIRLACNLSEPS
jgi:tRNA(Arg) A34 adenosine deaminase TadA